MQVIFYLILLLQNSEKKSVDQKPELHSLVVVLLVKLQTGNLLFYQLQFHYYLLEGH